MFCPKCGEHVDPVISTFDFWLRTGGAMMYNVEAQVQRSGVDQFIATTDSFGTDTEYAKLIGEGGTPEEAVADLREKLGHKKKAV